MEIQRFSGRKKSDAVLLDFGFRKVKDTFVYSVAICDGQFEVNVSLDSHSEVTSEVTDKDTGEVYVLHLLSGSKGAFVRQVKAAYEDVLNVIDHLCFDQSAFKSNDAQKLLEHIYETYGDTPQFLWAKSPTNAVIRHQDKGKWYAAFLGVKRETLGLAGAGRVEVINLKLDPNVVTSLVDGVRIFPGYHMNKKNWISVVLGEHDSLDALKDLIQRSYDITG